RGFAHDILRLEVAMDDSFGVSSLQRAANLANGIGSFGGGELAMGAKEGPEIVALDVLHSDELNPGGFAEVIDAHDILVADVAGKNQFLFKALQNSGVAG